MNAKEVLIVLRISRGMLTNNVKKDFIKTSLLPNGRYIYNKKNHLHLT